MAIHYFILDCRSRLRFFAVTVSYLIFLDFDSHKTILNCFVRQSVTSFLVITVIYEKILSALARKTFLFYSIFIFAKSPKYRSDKGSPPCNHKDIRDFIYRITVQFIYPYANCSINFVNLHIIKIILSLRENL